MTGAENQVLIRAEGVSKTYGSGSIAVQALTDLTLEVREGEVVVLLGPSGSGKTTCLNVFGAIEPPTSGRLEVNGINLVGMDSEAQTLYRRSTVGFVFQFFNLVPTLTALENVQLVAELGGADALERSRAALSDVGLAERVDHFPGQLSGGEQQRVAVARALVKNPPLLLCDEPTGSLDLETGRQVLGLLRDSSSSGRTVLLVTHNSAVAAMANRVLHLRDGRIVDDRHNEHPTPAAELEW